MIKAIWLSLTCVVLGVTLFYFDKAANPDISQFLFYAMLVLSFPSSLVVGVLLSYATIALHSAFGIEIESSYLSITLLWAALGIVGYLQWFVLVPFITERIRRRKRANEA